MDKTIELLNDIPIRWQGNFLFVGAIGIGFVGYDVRQTPNHFSAYVGREDNIVGWFDSVEKAKQEVERFIKDGWRPGFAGAWKKEA